MSAVAQRYCQRGQSALGSGDFDAAAESFRSAVELAPSYASARIGYAVALAKLGDCPRAAEILRTGLSYPTTPVAVAALLVTLGDVLTLSGDFLGAEQAFQQAAVQPSFVPRAASGLARVYAKQGRYADMVAQLRAAARRDANAPG